MQDGIELHCGDCLEVMKGMDGGSISAIVTDAPYGIAFMNAEFDTFHRKGMSDNEAFYEAMKPIFAEAFRVAKPGCHMMVFGGTRTCHRMACAVEDAGWEIRDQLAWVYSQSMPKGQRLDRQIEALLRHGKANSVAMRKVEQEGGGEAYTVKGGRNGMMNEAEVWNRKVFTPTEERAKEWAGWNSQLKPSFEPIVLARKPLKGTIAANVLEYGVGGINIDGCRITSAEPVVIHSPAKKTLLNSGHKDLGAWVDDRGRYPGNLVHDGAEEVLGLLPNGSDRFFYCAKASKAEKGEYNDHYTVKPIALMEWLVKMVTPPNGIVLDPFMGSGSTGVAARKLGLKFIGIEKDEHYFEIARRRLAEMDDQPRQAELF